MFKVSYFLEVLPIIASKVNITFELTVAATIFALIVGVIIAIIGYYKIPVLYQLTRVCLYYARYTGRSTVIFLLLWNCIIQCICKKYDTSYRSSGSYEF